MRWMPDAIPSPAARGGSSGPEPAPRRSAITPISMVTPVLRDRAVSEQDGGLMRPRRRWRLSVSETVLLAWFALALLNVVWRIPAEVVIGAAVVSVVAIAAGAVTERNTRA